MRNLRPLLAALGFSTTLASAAAPAPAPAPSIASAPAVTAAANGAHALTADDASAWLDGFLPYALARGDVAGAVVTVVKDGQIIAAKGYGYADIKKKIPVDPATTMFRPGSVSKLLTWTAVMQQVEAGKLDLDADVNTYLDFKLPERPDGPITLRHLMTHTAGFEEQIKGLITDDPAMLKPLGEYARDYAPIRIFKAGTTPAYSNYATGLAGHLVERVSGLKFDDYVEQRIFKPLRMGHSSFRQPLPKALEADMAQGYKQATQPPEKFEIVMPGPAGSLSASGIDMSRFMLAHLNDGELEGQRILSAATAKMMHGTPTDMIPPLNRMLLGFYEQNYNGRRVISHGGDTMFMHSYLHLLPDEKVGLFISLNSVGKEGAVSPIRNELFRQFLDRYVPATAQPAPTTAAAKQHARQVAGIYEISRRPDRSFLAALGMIQPMKVVANDDDTISFDALLDSSGSAPLRFREIAPYVWQDTASGWRIAAKMDGDRVERISHDQFAFAMVYQPFPAYRSPAWLRPALAVALAATLLTVLFWPIGAIVRWRLRAPLGLTGEGLAARRLTRLGSLSVFGMTALWLAVAVRGFTSYLFAPAFDKWLYVLYALSVFAYVGGAVMLVLGAVKTFRSGRPWYSKLWSLVLAASGLVLLYAAWATNLLSFQTRY
jgi:CubicO group peptidase (beta-lactamase class C family)